MAAYLVGLFTTDFMPHGACYMWEPATLWLHVGSDALIALAYYSIPLTLMYFVRKRTDLAFPYIFAMFGIFIFACGTTHLLGIFTVWTPFYRAEGIVKLATALISAATAVALVPLIPRALALPSPSQLASANRELAAQIGERERAENDLRLLNATLEQRVEERTAELTRSNADLERFAYAASHDMTEPLRMVRSYLQLLQSRYVGQLDQNADEFIGFAVGGAERMQAHIDGLLAYSRMRSKALAPSQVDLNAVFDDVVASLRLAVDERGGRVQRDDLPVVSGDAHMLRQLLLNLVANALKFSVDAPMVEIFSTPQSDGHVVTIRDHGIGVSPDDSERIFEIFQRLHSQDEYEGSGIGLSVCRTIAERHGGRIWVEPTAGGGASFHVWLPT